MRASDSNRPKLEEQRPSRREDKIITLGNREEEKKEGNGNGKKIEIIKVKDDIKQIIIKDRPKPVE